MYASLDLIYMFLSGIPFLLLIEPLMSEREKRKGFYKIWNISRFFHLNIAIMEGMMIS
jgi:hypothetical protein